MPRQAADLEEALKKKGGLTLSQLANYDDLITDALVDRVYFWSSIRKLKSTYHACRGVQEQDVCDILQKHAIIEKEPTAAQKRLLALPGIQKFSRALKTEDEKEHFERHLRKYINIYLPDCPFEVGTTNRYTVMTAEAAIYARKHIRKGETIKYLSGIQVEMTEKEEQELSSRTDFSIVLSSRRKRPSLFLGPARFANHDCDSNARLNTHGPHGMNIVARKEIAPGHEITVTYGEDYFGEDNCECLCNTCETLERNGWDPRGPLLKDDSSDEDEDDDEEAVEVPRRAAAPSAHMKRKREGEEPRAVKGGSGDVTKRRAPGRPRKKRRLDDSEEDVPRTVKSARANEREPGAGAEDDDDSPESQPDRQGRFANRKATSNPARPEITDVKRSRSWDRVARGPSQEPPQDDLLEKIKKLLGSVSDRVLRQTASPEKIIFEEALVKTEARDIYEVADSDDDCSDWPRDGIGRLTDRRSTANNTLTQQATPKYARGMSRSPERAPFVSSERSYARALSRSPERGSVGAQSGAKAKKGSKPNAALGTPKSRKPAIKNERSFSTLRNVTNASEAWPDVYSVPDSPSPPPERRIKRSEDSRPAKGAVEYMSGRSRPWPRKTLDGSMTRSRSREGDHDIVSAAPVPAQKKRGRPRKYPRADDSAAATLESSAESISPSSHGTDSSSHGSTASSATSVDTFAAGNIAQNICMMLTNDIESLAKTGSGAVDECEPDTEQRGRTVKRRSARQAPAAQSAAPVRSIEFEDAVKDGHGEQSDEKRGPVRAPRDYHLCLALLATTYHRWIQCRNCDEHFVQAEAFLTRIACPRCERHSKLYGYYWPKTDKEGKYDNEERVLDHRTIHRFIEPEEERAERKGKKGLEELRKEEEEREESLQRESEESERPADRRLLRGSPRRSESRRKLRAMA
ncbi:hypothetical protein LTR08_006690 [Meristemomyces frigidus]|nr:hypothetical protein LTR08_006690 [Meristemomyces frigidus]